MKPWQICSTGLQPSGTVARPRPTLDAFTHGHLRPGSPSPEIMGLSSGRPLEREAPGSPADAAARPNQFLFCLRGLNDVPPTTGLESAHCAAHATRDSRVAGSSTATTTTAVLTPSDHPCVRVYAYVLFRAARLRVRLPATSLAAQRSCGPRPVVPIAIAKFCQLLVSSARPLVRGATCPLRDVLSRSGGGSGRPP